MERQMNRQRKKKIQAAAYWLWTSAGQKWLRHNLCPCFSQIQNHAKAKWLRRRKHGSHGLAAWKKKPTSCRNRTDWSSDYTQVRQIPKPYFFATAKSLSLVLPLRSVETTTSSCLTRTHTHTHVERVQMAFFNKRLLQFHLMLNAQWDSVLAAVTSVHIF